MPRRSVIAIRAALVYLMTGFSLGALLLINKGYPFGAWVWNFLPAHIETLLVGWVAQLILGVAFWILPRFPGGSRGNVRLAAWAVALLNAGILVIVIQAFWPAPHWLSVLARVLEIAAALFFVLHAWKRVRPAY